METFERRFTYGAGRYIEFIKEDKKPAVLDFNRAYNPPCSFSAFTTCIFPPQQNWLPIEMLAGEKEALLNELENEGK